MMPAPMPPAAPESELAVISAAMLDPARVLPMLREVGLSADWFTDDVCQRTWPILADAEPTRADLSTLGADLRAAGRDDLATFWITGGTDHASVPALVPEHIRRLKDAHRNRRLRELGQQLAEADTDAGRNEIITAIEELQQDTGYDVFRAYTLVDLESYQVDPQAHLVGDGWLRAGAGALLTGGTGMGKSVLAEQIAVSVAAGLSILGCVRVHRPARVLCVQAENDAETLKRDVCAIVEAIGADRAKVQENLRVVHAYGLAGNAFAAYVRAQVRKHRAELLVIDPYQAYIGGMDLNVSKTFLDWIKPIDAMLKETCCGLLLVAHTPKPKDRQDWHVRESVYLAAGHSVISNWARASVELMPAGTEDGRFRLRFSKNAERVGLVDNGGKMVRDLFIEHSGNRHKPFWRVGTDQTAPTVGKYDEAIRQQLGKDPNANDNQVAVAVGCDRATVGRRRRAMGI